jgi:amidase
MPDPERWYGLSVLGGIGRSVLDVALFDDAIRGAAAGDRYRAPEPPTSFAQAAQAPPRPLRIAVSLKGVIPATRPDQVARRAVEETAQLLGGLGHGVADRDPAYGFLFPDIVPPYLAGVAEMAESLDDPRQLEPRSRRMAALGRRVSGRPLRRALARMPVVAARINAIFAEHDVLLTPVTASRAQPRGKWARASALRSFHASGPYVTYTAIWNYLGQPAASVPAGFDEQGMPAAVQICGPPGSESTLISLAAQLEQARPWTDRRPPVS